jgi:hypothetical protein
MSKHTFRRIDQQALKDLVSQLPYKEGGQSYITTCPKCSKPKLYIRKRDGRFVCFVCRETEQFFGAAEYALKELLPLSLSELCLVLYGEQTASSNQGRLALNLRDFYGDDEENPDEQDEGSPEPSMLPVDTFPMDASCSASGREYLLGRGIIPSMWDKYGIVYWPSQRRVMFPVIHDGEVYGYQARTVLSGVQPKILTSTGLKRDRLLMFSDGIQEGGHAVLCEGPVDALKCDLMGGAVAAMGKVVTDKQIDILRKKKVKRVYLALDPDAADEMGILIKKLKPEFEVYQIKVPAPYKDLGEMSLEGAYECFLNAQVCSPAHSMFKLKPPKMWG